MPLGALPFEGLLPSFCVCGLGAEQPICSFLRQIICCCMSCITIFLEGGRLLLFLFCSMRFHMLHIGPHAWIANFLNFLPIFDPQICCFGFRANGLLFSTMQPNQDAHVVCVNCCWCTQPFESHPKGCHFRHVNRSAHLNSCIHGPRVPMHWLEFPIVIQLHHVPSTGAMSAQTSFSEPSTVMWP